MKREGTLELEGEVYTLGANEVALFDPVKLHGLVNTGSLPMRYMVIIAC